MGRTVTIIAPVPPFRGGIAHHSAALARAFNDMADCDVAVESFSRLYPQFLYPGESAYDPAGIQPGDVPANCELDVLNPLSWRRLAKRVAARGGVAVIPCWTFFAAPCLGWIARSLRKHGVAVAMLVHNVGDHEGAGWKNALTHWQLAGAARFVTHSAELQAQLRAAGLQQPCTVMDHPPYSHFPEPTGTLTKEAGLELLCFGLVRPYKGVDIALRGLARSGIDDVRLTIAGEIWDGAEDLRQLAADPMLEGKIAFRDCYQSDQDAAELFDRADALLLPYRSITGSGVLAMAQHYRCPVVASDLPALTRTIARDRLGWTFATGDAEQLGRLLAKEVTRESCERVSREMAAPDLSGWNAMAQALVA